LSKDDYKSIIVAIIGGAASLGVAMIGQGGLIDRFFSPVVEVALRPAELDQTILDQTELDQLDQQLIPYIQNARAAVERGDLKTGITQVDLALQTLEDKKVWDVIATVTNYGSQPATNLTLYFRAPSTNKFINITNQFSTADIVVRNFGKGSQEVKLYTDDTILVSALNTRQTYVEVNTPKFSHGTGSKIVLALRVENKPNLDPYANEFDASALYNQGSTRWIPAEAWSYKGFIDTLTKPNAFLIMLLVAVIVAVEFVLWWGENHRWFMKITGGVYTPRRVQTDWGGRIIRGVVYSLIAFGVIRALEIKYLPIFLIIFPIAIVIVEFVLWWGENHRWFMKQTASGGFTRNKEKRAVQTDTRRRVICGVLYFVIAFIIWSWPIGA
jgi:hypothetical protein